MTKGWLLPLLVLGAACKGGSGKPASAHKDAGIAELTTLNEAGGSADAPDTPWALGQPSVSDFAYRTRAGQPAFVRAREAEAAGNWDSVLHHCGEALAQDPQHLDAAYLMGVALAKTNAEPKVVLAAVSRAVTGDFLKWGRAVLAQPALQATLATPAGIEWTAHVEAARRQFTAVLARALLVNAGGDIFAYDITTPRWYRLTRTGGAVVATFRVKGVAKLVYVTRGRDPKSSQPRVGIGLIDLAEPRSKRNVRLPAVSEAIRVAYNHDKKVNAFVIYSKGWFALDDSGDAVALTALPAKDHPGNVASLTEMASIDVRGRTAHAQRLQLPNIAADFDEHRLASALKIDTTKRIVTVPSPGLIDGNTVTWSPDHAQLAFIAQLTDECAAGTPTSAAFVADASTGTARELEHAVGGMAIEWIADRMLAIAGDTGVAVYDLAGVTTPIVGATSLAIPRRTPECAAPPDDTDPVATDDEVSDVATDAGIP